MVDINGKTLDIKNIDCSAIIIYDAYSCHGCTEQLFSSLMSMFDEERIVIYSCCGVSVIQRRNQLLALRSILGAGMDSFAYFCAAKEGDSSCIVKKYKVDMFPALIIVDDTGEHFFSYYDLFDEEGRLGPLELYLSQMCKD